MAVTPGNAVPPRLTVVLAGPTAVGKTDVALTLARQLDAEIISADSAQVYRGLDIGTAKPSAADRAAVRHHLVDVVDPDRPFSVADYQREAIAALYDIWARGRRALVVGGTGLWIRALIHRFPFAPEPDREHWRRVVQGIGERQGWDHVRRLVRLVDPVAWRHIAPADHRRLARVLEVFWGTGRRPAHQAPTPWLPVSFWVLTRPAAQLRRRIAERAHRMLAAGLVEEVGNLLRAGVPPRAQSLSAIGYRETVDWWLGRLAGAELEPLIVRHTQQYAKRQWTWFRGETGAHWIDLDAWPPADVVAHIVAAATAAEQTLSGQTLAPQSGPPPATS